MLRSMTGFGAAAGQVEGVQYAVESRSVNNRYFKTAIKLPEAWFHAEAEIEKLIRRDVRRGTVMLSVRMRVRDDQAAGRVNAAALSAYLDQLRPIEAGADPIMRVDLASLLALPGVCEPPALDELCQQTRDGMMAVVAEALEAMVQMRQHEGRAIEADLLAHCESVERHLASVREMAPRVVEDYRRRLTDRIAELTGAGNLPVDENLLAREVAVFAERCDIAEEIARLTGHIEQFREAVTHSAPTGRKLDFIAQEMLREANTIASKANDLEIARATVEIKTAIDRIKEQVQNVE